MDRHAPTGFRPLPLAMLGVGVTLVLTACAANPAPLTPHPAHLTLLHINDVYEITPAEAGKAGGLSRIATLLRRLKQQDSTALLTLGGDFVSPSALGTARVEGQRLGGRQMIAVLNAAGLGIATFGNHEFDLSEAELGRRVDESKFRYLSSNVTDSLGAPLYGTPRHLILRLGPERLRVGIVAATINQVRKPNLRYQGPISSLRREIAAIRDSVDVLIALTHLALQEDATLADSIPELDLILGGHEHENWTIRRGPGFTPVLKADANARSAMLVHITPHPGGRPTVDWRLIPVTDSIAQAPDVQAEAERWTRLAYAAFRADGLEPESTVVRLPVALDAREIVVRNRENDFTRLITDAARHEVPEAEVALFNSGSIRIDDIIPAGPITQYDVIRILPFGGKAVLVEMTGALLQRTLEQGDNNQGIGGFLLKSGAARSASGWQVGNAPLDTLKRYKVVATDFLVSGGEQNLSWLSPRNPGLAEVRTLRDIRLVVIDELRRRFPRR